MAHERAHACGGGADKAWLHALHMQPGWAWVLPSGVCGDSGVLKGSSRSQVVFVCRQLGCLTWTGRELTRPERGFSFVVASGNQRRSFVLLSTLRVTRRELRASVWRRG